MPYALPTAAEFKTRHPRFAAVSDALVAAMLAEASRSAGDLWAEVDWRDATMNLTAHLMIEEGAGQSGIPAATSGPVRRVKAGDVETEFAVAASGSAGAAGVAYSSTAYGRRYLDIRARYTAGAALVV